MISTTEMESPSNTENNTNKDTETTDSSQGEKKREDGSEFHLLLFFSLISFIVFFSGGADFRFQEMSADFRKLF